MNRTASRTRTAGLVVAALGVAVLAMSQFGCAAQSTTAIANPMPAARAGLRPEYRVFYDELRDYGDWVLIEPYGFVFRPKTRFNEWSPYNDGFWSPSDSYGWVWVSGEPFGWATYHYGAWINDGFQGWVWVPGLEWAPAWVAWTGNQNYVGWAALSPSGAPASSFNVVPRANLAATDLKSHVLAPAEARAAIRNADPIENLDEVDHVTVNRGPRIDWIEQAAGPLQRARVEDMTPRRTITSPGTGSEMPSERTSRPAPAMQPVREIHQAAETAAAQARTAMQAKEGASPPVITRIRLPVTPPPAPPKRGWQQAQPDSSH